jgi:hypothetical protein
MDRPQVNLSLLRSNSLKFRPLDDKKREITVLQEVETKAKATFQKETQRKFFLKVFILPMLLSA